MALGLYPEGAIVTGVVPMWSVPETVWFAEHTPGIWSMQKAEIDVMELYKKEQTGVMSPIKKDAHLEDIVKQAEIARLGERVEVAAPRVAIPMDEE